MKKSNWIYDVIFTVVFSLSTVGLEYAVALRINWIEWILMGFMALCMFGAAQTGLIPGIIVALIGPIAGAEFALDIHTLNFAIVLAVANIALVVCYWAFQKKRLLGVVVGSAARYAILYLLIELLIPVMDLQGDLYASVVGNMDWSYLLAPLIAGLVFWLIAALMGKTKKKTQTENDVK